MGQMQTDDLSIHDNEVIVELSTINAISYVNVTDLVDHIPIPVPYTYTDVGNSYGILLGMTGTGSSGEGSVNEQTLEDLSIHDNKVNVKLTDINANSTLNLNTLSLRSAVSGGSYGISFGNPISEPTILTQNNFSFDNSIHDNTVKVFASILNSAANNTFGSAYGINFGSSEIDETLSDTTGNVFDTSVYKNNVKSTDNIFIVSANNGNAYGINIGNAIVNQTMETTSPPGDTSDDSINNNSIDNSIHENKIISTNNIFNVSTSNDILSMLLFDNNAYGINVGNSNVSSTMSIANPVEVRIDNDIIGNNILSINDMFKVSLGGGAAYGINVGNGSLNSSITSYDVSINGDNINNNIDGNNILSINDIFKINARSGAAYGINVGNGSASSEFSYPPGVANEINVGNSSVSPSIAYINSSIAGNNILSINNMFNVSAKEGAAYGVNVGNGSVGSGNGLISSIDNSIIENNIFSINNMFNVSVEDGTAYGINVGNTSISSTIVLAGFTASVVNAANNIDNSIIGNNIFSINNMFNVSAKEGAAYGINVGNDSISSVIQNFTNGSIDNSINGNNIISIGNVFKVSAVDGSAYGINVSNGEVDSTITGISTDSNIYNNIYQNNITAAYNFFDIDANGSGSAYGINVGNGSVASYVDPSSTNSFIYNNIYDNNIIANYNIFDVNANDVGSAYGISLGENGDFDNTLEKNAISASCNSFNIGSTNGDSWGIWIAVPPKAGEEGNTTLNADAATANKFILTAGNGGNGAKILWPNGDETLWH